MRTFSMIRQVLLIMTVAIMAVSCGSSRNDQGVAFTLYGFHPLNDEGVVELELYMSGWFGVPIDVPGFESYGTSYRLIGGVGIQNNLSGMTIRTQRVEVDYIVPGASMNPPSHSHPLPIVLAPASAGQSTLPTGITSGGGNTTSAGLPTTYGAPFTAVPHNIFSWISLNRDSLPEPPFTMEAVVRVYGVTSAGDEIVTNELSLTVDFVTANPIAPSQGSLGAIVGGDSSSSVVVDEEEATPEDFGAEPIFD